MVTLGTAVWLLSIGPYDLTTGRFLTRDTLPAATMDTSQLDHYAYTQDNPVNPSDPSGHDPLDEDALVTNAIVTVGSIGIRVGVGEIIREILTDLLILLGVIGLGWINWWQLTHPRSTARPTAIPRPQPTTEPDTYIYRQGPDRPKTVALRRLDD